jgi:hypothetical protein
MLKKVYIVSILNASDKYLIMAQDLIMIQAPLLHRLSYKNGSDNYNFGFSSSNEK